MAEVITEARRQELLESYFRTRVETAPEALEAPSSSPAANRTEGADLPLTFAQQQLWLHGQLAPNTALYNEPLTVRHHGALDSGVLRRALNEIVRRHEAWRTTFPVIAGEPVQRVLPPFAL